MTPGGGNIVGDCTWPLFGFLAATKLCPALFFSFVMVFCVIASLS